MGPRGIILEPNEKVLLATRPLFLWEPLVIIDILLLVLALYFTSLRYSARWRIARLPSPAA